MRHLPASSKVFPGLFVHFVLLLCLLCFGCSKKIEPAPAPAPVPRYEFQPSPSDKYEMIVSKTLFFATNRTVKVDRNGSQTFENSRAKNLSYGQCNARIAKVDIPQYKKLFRKFQYWIGVIGTDPYDKANIKIEILNKSLASSFDGFLSLLNITGVDKQDKSTVLLFIHGYNNSFDDAAKSAAAISYLTSFPGQTIFFSWPSKGRDDLYFIDRNTAYWSVKHIEDFLVSLAASEAINNIHIVAHSMGNEILVRAFSNIARGADQKRKILLSKFKSISLAAPDVDRDTFCDQFSSALDRSGARLTLYASKNDRALFGSEGLQGGFEYVRLGQHPQSCEDSRNFTVVDASNAGADLWAHSAVYTSFSVAYDLGCNFRDLKREDNQYISKCKNEQTGRCWVAWPKK